MTRSSESRAQRASRRGRSEDENNPGEREAARQPEERPRSRGHRRRSKSREAAARSQQEQEQELMNDEMDDKLRTFIQILSQGAPQPQVVRGPSKYGPPKIDKQKAKNILEAMAGNMALAANLYWEDYFAADQLGESNHNRRDNEESEDQKPAAGGSDNDDQCYEKRRDSPKSKRRLRRSLEADFQAADDDDETKRKKRAKKRARKSGMGDSNEDDNDDDEQKMPAIRRNNQNNNPQERPPPRRRSSRRPPVDEEDSGSGDEDHIISVSDDEFGRVGYYKDSNPARRRSREPATSKVSRSAVMKAARDLNLKIDPDTTQLSKPSTWFLSPEEGKRRPRKKDDESIDSNSEDYIGDEDWLGDETYTPSIPMEYLWGAAHDYWTIDPYEEGEAEQKKNDESNGNVTADDEDDDEDDAMEQEKVDEKNKEAFKSVPLLVEGGENRGIPHTWLNAGFQLSDCGSGLIIKSPTVEEVEFFAWRQKQVNDKRNAVPPPQHCKSLTSITSIVTGLLYSGASVQGNEVNFTSGKAPWASLTVEQRKREFESRLADALSSLIFVAAQASLKRKRKAYRKALKTGEVIQVERNMSDLFKEALEKRNASLSELEKKQQAKGDKTMAVNVVKDHVNRSFTKEALSVSTDTRELMRRRLELIPTCVWAEKKDVVKPRPGDALCFFNVDAKVKISWTNIRDIKLYVESNLRAFTEKGGIALFLETLLRIHGDNYIGRQLIRCASVTSSISVTGKRGGEIPEKGSRGEFICKGGKTTVPLQTVYAAGYPSLIRCTCECRQKKIHEENPLPLNVRTDPTKLLDTTPPGTECVSIEFLSLILTGHVSSNWKDCSSDKLGIGLLTETVGEVSQSLARPKQPVWMIQGETCYTMLAIDGAWTRNGASNACESSSYGEDLKTISRVDKPNVALNLIHWNGWYGQRSKTGMRLVTPYSKKPFPSNKLLSQFSEPAGKMDTKSLIMRRRRHEHVLNAISAEQHTSSQEQEIPIRPIELKRIQIYEQDQKLYPKNHKLWRFDLGEEDDDLGKKPSTQSWIPYFKLNPRQKRLVETKLGPKINSILWTRWPGAVIDNFTDSEDGFPVV